MEAKTYDEVRTCRPYTEAVGHLRAVGQQDLARAHLLDAHLQIFKFSQTSTAAFSQFHPALLNPFLSFSYLVFQISIGLP